MSDPGNPSEIPPPIPPSATALPAERMEVVPPNVPPGRYGPPAGAPTRPQGKKPGRPASFWVALVLFLALGFSMLLNFGFALMRGASGLSHGARGYHEEYLGGSGDNKIVVIEVHGLLMDAGGMFFLPGASVVKRTIAQLRQAAEDPDVRAIVLSVNSPGGGVTDSDEIHHEVVKAKNAGKRIVVHMGDLCASGGYYISAPADAIVASPTTITGSIGVIIHHMNTQKLMEEKLGIKADPIKSGPHKDILSSDRPMTAEERAIMQNLVDKMYARFVDLVIEGRTGHPNFPSDRPSVQKIADGRVYTGDEAVGNGLADRIGYMEDAYEEARKAAGLGRYKLIRYVRQPSLMDILGGEASTKVNINTGVQIDAANFVPNPAPRLQYLWAPGR